MKEKVICLIRGIEIEQTKEEKVRQNFLKILLEDYGYQKKDIVLEYGVKRSPSDNRRSLPVDIAIFENGKAKIFVETKKPTVNEGLSQLKNYMDFDDEVRYGVWTNGNFEADNIGILYVEKVVSDRKIQYNKKFNIPKKGFANIQEEIQKKDLLPTNNLKDIFKKIRGFISANATGTTRDEKILNELMSLLMCKVYDERYKSDNDYMDFRIVNEDEHLTANKVKEIFNERVKVKYKEIFTDKDTIDLDDNIISHVVGQLQMYSLTKSSHQAISDAFESIIGYASKGSQGQFFTPKNVVELMVSLLQPEEYKSLLDPASGTAGFLINSMNYVWNNIDKKNMEELAILEEKKDYAMKYLYGIEKDDFLAKMSKGYMAILGDGKSGIFIENSLNENRWNSSTLGAIKTSFFDYILTNPPFGKDIKLDNETKKLYKYEKIELAFLERSIDLLKDGGILGIILPETIFHSPTNKKVRDDFFYKHNILAIADIPHDTFRPYNNAKCDIIFIQKNRPQQEKVLAIKINNIGHNHLGEVDYVYDLETNTFDETKINDDTIELVKAIKNSKFNLKVNSKNDQLELESNLVRYVDFKEIEEEDVLVARNYFEESLDTQDKVMIDQLIKEKIIHHFDGHGSPRGYLKGMGDIPYVRVKDIVNLEVYINPMDLIPKFEYERLYSKNKKLKAKDIVFVRRGSYRIGDVGILYSKDLESILTREILVLRLQNDTNKYNLTPFNFLYLMNSDAVRKQLANKIMLDTTLPNIADRWKKLYLPIYDKDTMDKISREVETIYNKREDFWNGLAALDISLKKIKQTLDN